MKIIFRHLFMLISLFSIASFSACKKYVGGDTNINPNQSSTPTLNTLLPVVIESTTDNHFRVAFITSMFSEQLAAYTSGALNEDQNRDVRIENAFQGIYQNSLTNLDAMVKLAQQQNAPYYIGIGKILQAVNLGLATDTWGDVPYSDAFQGAANLYPKYDSQETIYTTMQTLLDDGIAQLSLAPGTIKPTTDDLIYGGVAASWIKAAYVLKARYAMHLTKKGATNAANMALTYLAKGFASNAEDLQVVYNDKNLNPWNKNIAVAAAGAVYKVSPTQRLIDLMNGSGYYPGLVDPRLPIIMDNKSAATYIGIVNGSGGSGNVNLTANTYYAKASSPVPIVTYAEQKFLEAEAEFIKAGGTTTSVGSSANAYSAYLAGINANMDKLSAVKAAYIANPLVAVTATGLKLEYIMREKNIALFLHPEEWVDVRRYDYNAQLFRGMALPQNQDAAMNGQFIRRALYPLAETTRNPNAVAAQKTLTTKVWWDQ
ncbi:MAG: SusD/RagB family nutrient-binding outer membrane lipoprotein [Janthinobacterium lividum]